MGWYYVPLIFHPGPRFGNPSNMMPRMFVSRPQDWSIQSFTAC